MENNNTKKQNVYISEEEKTLKWDEIQSSFKKTFGIEIYNSWLQKISLVKEFNDYLVLGVPTRFFRDWIVSRYLDKILDLLQKDGLLIFESQAIDVLRKSQFDEKFEILKSHFNILKNTMVNSEYPVNVPQRFFLVLKRN